MVCSKCNSTSRFVQFSTFSYHYCDQCKVEVGQVAQPLKVEAVSEAWMTLGTIKYKLKVGDRLRREDGPNSWVFAKIVSIVQDFGNNPGPGAISFSVYRIVNEANPADAADCTLDILIMSGFNVSVKV